MNRHDSNLITNLFITLVVLIALYMTHSLWSLLGFLFLLDGKNRDCKDEDEGEI